MTKVHTQDRKVLMLQGPHGPFFGRLAGALRVAGSAVWRIGFNQGDQVFWGRQPGFIPYLGIPKDWPRWLAAFLDEHGITDIVLYGDTRPVHAEAIRQAKAGGITVHVFEEGYLRPYWVTYERGGSNGHSRLMQMSVTDMRAALARSDMAVPEAPTGWGEMRQHIFYGALYHFFVLIGKRRYSNYISHRSIAVAVEFRLYLWRLLLMPWHRLERVLATAQIRFGGFPYHLVLMQLEHDASFQQHSDFASMTDFVDLCLETFAAGAPRHHHLVFKAHPLEDERVAVVKTIRATARRLSVRNRVHFVRGGKLAMLLDRARSAVTVNSTSAQQALRRGLPLKALGTAVYSKPEFVSSQDLPDFFALPDRPDTKAYRDYRQYLLETSQIPGGYYSARGRRELLRQVVDMVLAPLDPYDMLQSGKAAPRQQLAPIE
jgi:capsular polysaccharide export protein